MKRGKASIVWRLLRKNISAGQLIGYSLANLVGLTIVLVALQFYVDMTDSLESEDTFVTRDYLIVSKRISGAGALFGRSSSFSKGDIDNLNNQDWVENVGQFTSATFNVSVALQMEGQGLSTYMFFESVPDRFFDVKPRGWGFDPSRPKIPIVLSRDYLALYNFGFATTRGLPQVSESMVGMLPLRVSVSGNGQQQYFNASIVGFSSRLNTIAVPEDFMKWANQKFGDRPTPDPSRLIIEVNSPGNPKIEEYLNSHNYEQAGDKLDNSKMAYFLSVVTGLVVAIGVVISALAFFILILSLYLLLQKNKEKLANLLFLGYTPRQVSNYYHRLVIAINVVVLGLSLTIMLLVRMAWLQAFSDLDMATGSPWVSIMTGTLLVALITIGSVAAVSRNVKRLF